MTTLVYDGTYEGWLTAVFHIYEYKMGHVFFAKERAYIQSLFAAPRTVVTDEKKVARVLRGLAQRLSEEAIQNLYQTFLSEMDRVEDVMWRFVQYAFASQQCIETNFGHSAVLTVSQTAKKVFREAHRMEAFVRFQLTKDSLYYAIVEPDYNVLPLISEHFRERYADQKWLIYDAKRKYGLYYDLQTVVQVELKFNFNLQTANSVASISDEREDLFQDLWRRYFSSVNIKARKNMRLHLQHMPRRYWKHLVEKRPAIVSS
jgi:probable DNA metabolism protein